MLPQTGSNEEVWLRAKRKLKTASKIFSNPCLRIRPPAAIFYIVFRSVVLNRGCAPPQGERKFPRGVQALTRSKTWKVWPINVFVFKNYKRQGGLKQRTVTLRRRGRKKRLEPLIWIFCSFIFIVLRLTIKSLDSCIYKRHRASPSFDLQR